jgi:hypothetical protein
MQQDQDDGERRIGDDLLGVGCDVRALTRIHAVPGPCQSKPNQPRANLAFHHKSLKAERIPSWPARGEGKALD